MKNNCEKLKLPFEVLIQGPSGNRFVRNLMYADPNNQQEFCPKNDLETIKRKTRSTLSIYKPIADDDKIMDTNHQQLTSSKDSMDDDNINDMPERLALDAVREQQSNNNDDATEYEVNYKANDEIESIIELNKNSIDHQQQINVAENPMKKRQAVDTVGNAQDNSDIVGAAAPDVVGMAAKKKVATKFDIAKLKEKMILMQEKMNLAKVKKLPAIEFKELGIALKLKTGAEKNKLKISERKLAFDKLIGSKKLLGNPLQLAKHSMVGAAAAPEPIVGAPNPNDIVLQPAHTL